MGSVSPSSSSSPTRTLLVIGSGPLVSRSMTTLFASKRYNQVALFARRSKQLAKEKFEVEAAAPGTTVRTFAVDITDATAFTKALDDVDAEFGKPECVLYNAARVKPSELLTHDVHDVEYELKVQVSALYMTSQRYVPHLISLSRTDPTSHPSLLVPSSYLPYNPVPQLFNVSLAKAAQRNLVQSLHQTYASEGIRVGIVNIGGPVSETEKIRNPVNIARKTWEWVEGSDVGDFEVKIGHEVAS